MGAIASFFVTVPVGLKVGKWVQERLFNYLTNTKYVSAYREGDKVTLHVTSNLGELRKESAPYQAIVADTLRAVSQTLELIKANPKFRNVTTIEAVSRYYGGEIMLIRYSPGL